MSSFSNLRGKVAVVTGGASGIGKGTARQLIAEGMHVVIADVERDALERTAAELGAVGIHTDVSDLESVRALSRSVVDRFGTVHVVCNNAGVGPIAKVSDLRIEDWHWMLGVNLYGVIHGVQTFLPILKANADGGHIVNTASIFGLFANPPLAAYSVSKYGVVALTEALAVELAEEDSKVGVTVLCPSTVQTNVANSTRNRPECYRNGALSDFEMSKEEYESYRWLTPDEAGAIVVRAITRGDLYAITHPESYSPLIEQRHRNIAAAFERAAVLEREAEAVGTP
ncbi:NADP-dependent 3-hydroxy acid dehydrogenase YdfG [Nocardia tenerifensis]|uniref:NADP-dependent 3-hydroxy acid dehydrogenase YdfG n=1 Tax=Nocardia tenerifensis TaxID=228006 RepID=A0A318JWM3_9NOCA|nr:SDR family NAD(P)-dependent oxidoreductase [Nocardia tenerifensis]PXX58036.1 NADP-dependent 3-hydroxy acid dehydrogenase YdfG [Nocardia tenerifensis]